MIGSTTTNYSEGYIEFKVSIKNSATTNVQYNGTEFRTDNRYLVLMTKYQVK